MQPSTDDRLKRAVFLGASRHLESAKGTSSESKFSSDEEEKRSHCLLYKGKINLPHRPIRMRHLQYSNRRLLLYGENGYQEMAMDGGSDIYSLKEIFWHTHMCDCVQTNDQLLYTVTRDQSSAVIASYDETLTPQAMVHVSYPLGCLSSLATNAASTYLYGTNEELNCILRFTTNDLSLSEAERFGTLWRPFDSCTSQVFTRQDGTEAQFLFVSNLDAGIFVFDLETMEVVAECGNDLSPGAKYLAYDPNRSLLFVSSSYDRLLRCYRMELPPTAPAPPALHKVGDFLVVKRKPSVRSSGPQGVMWDPGTGHLAVVSWSNERGKFRSKLFSVTV